MNNPVNINRKIPLRIITVARAPISRKNKRRRISRVEEVGITGLGLVGFIVPLSTV
jgi:preprotein translocase subunit Sss1